MKSRTLVLNRRNTILITFWNFIKAKRKNDKHTHTHTSLYDKLTAINLKRKTLKKL